MKSFPEKWTRATLGDVTEVNPRHAKNLDDSLSVTFIPMALLSEDNWDFKAREERLLGEVRKGFTHFADGDILFAKITPCMENGKAAIATNLKNGIGCGTTELHVLRPRGAVLPKYLYHFVHRERFRREAVTNFTGTAGQLRVPVSFINETYIPLPPLNEQRRIVAKLDELLAKVDACKARLDKIPAILKRFRQSVLAAACSGRLTADWREQNLVVEPAEELLKRIKGSRNSEERPEQRISHSRLGDLPEIPGTWKYVCTDELLEDIKYGTAKRCGHQQNLVPVLRIPNVSQGKIDHSDIKYTEFTKKEYEQLKLISGDILLIRSNGSVSLVGKAALVTEEEAGYAYAGYLIRLRFNKDFISSEFVNHALSSYYTRLQIEIPARSTSGVHNINGREVGSLILPLPPLQEQIEIVKRLKVLFKLSDQIEKRYQIAKVHIDKLTQSILAKAFRGELVPQDPNDEPAAKLLERIQAERERNVTPANAGVPAKRA